jgi:hypothetical protein
MAVPKWLTISAKKMQKTFKNILLQHNFPKKRAEECATIFTQNSVDGIYTHGVKKATSSPMPSRRLNTVLAASNNGMAIWGQVRQMPFLPLNER